MQATDGTGSAVRVDLFDYRKVFDYIDHQQLLTRKMYNLDIPRGVARWVVDFSVASVSERKALCGLFLWVGPRTSRCTSGDKIAAVAIPVHDKRFKSSPGTYFNLEVRWWYDGCRERGDAKADVKVVQDSSRPQKIQLNADKCKVMVIDFKSQKHHFIPLMLDGKELEIVNKAKVLGVTISCNLKWNNHVNESIKKSKQTPILSRPLKESPRFGGRCS